MAKSKKSRLQSCLAVLFVAGIIGTLIGLVWIFVAIRSDVKLIYGEPEQTMSSYKKILYTSKLYLAKDNLLMDQNDLEEDYYFEIIPGETVSQISFRLKSNGLILDSEAFKDFLIYKGFDRKVQSGYFRIEPAMNGIEIAEKITSLIPDKVRFNILPGWRMEEIAAILPQSGLEIDPNEFLLFASNPSSEWLPDGFKELTSLEGYLHPGEYLIDREISTTDFLKTFLNSFESNLNNEILQSFEQRNLSLSQAIIIASIVEREAVMGEEMSLIAAVFLNRYNIGMKLQSDPTVQYAVGYNINQATWWTNPLSLQDLQKDSLFNTYLYSDLPPHPICNPSLNAIQAVANAEETPYYYFRAKCDGSGYHNFSETYEEHLEYGCP